MVRNLKTTSLKAIKYLFKSLEGMVAVREEGGRQVVVVR